ncbi:TIGR02677 family protein [Actinomadura madurae]|uniref:TIGR02677 family protein n=1 Tax=Actinomadura madurae TaxID=1993 RepID=UPI0020275A74|nr:TIGR02677 family protein [Actinomadura madurae]URM99575.1 TIGR02677 family protein [Actinomadura madurae]
MALPRVPEGMFSFTTTERADVHTAVMHAFGEANERLETSLAFDEVRERLRDAGFYAPVDDALLTRALEQLVRWQLLDVVQNHAGSYATAEEYERKNLQYSLTQRGEAAFAGVQHALAVLTSSGALQTAVLDAIADRLGELGELLKDDDPAVNRRIFTTLQELEGHLDALRNNTKSFNGELQRLMRAEGADLATFNDVKSATVAYLQEFVTNLDMRADAIHTTLGEVEDRGVSVLHGRALDGAELPPVQGADPAVAWLAARQAKWEGLRLWFRPAEGTPRVRQLHDVARRAIVSLLQVLDRITESRRRSSSAAADFRTLARWFANAPGEDDAHRLWGTAFGLASARHAHLAHGDPEPIPTAASWDETPPVEVSALLRTSGRTERVGRTAKVRDVRALRAERRERARRERAELEAAWQWLATDGPVRLSSFGRVEHDTLRRLLDLIGRALAVRPGGDGLRRAGTSDGRIEVRLWPPADGRAAELSTPRGVFRGPDYLVDIRFTAAGPARKASGA